MVISFHCCGRTYKIEATRPLEQLVVTLYDVTSMKIVILIPELTVTNSTKHMPSSKASGSSAVKKFAAFYETRNVHFRVHNRPPIFPTLSQMKQVDVHPNDVFRIHFNIIFQSTPESSERSVSLMCLHQNGVRNNLLLV
jgi:hypothetical protein